LNISGVVVACRPQSLDAVARAVEAFAWAQVHHRDDSGRLVVTIEAADADEGAARLQDLQGVEHVAMAEVAESVTLPADD
jgi:nitrate reductase NapAB chaperone NapD